MKRKNILIIIVSFITFILGMTFQNYIITPKNNNFDKQINEILVEDNRELHFDVFAMIGTLKDWGGDTTDNSFLLLKRIDSISSYFEYILSSSEEIYKFSLENIYIDFGHEIPIDLFYKKAKEVDINKLTLEEAKLYINVCRNIIIKKYLAKYNDIYSLTISKGRCLFVSKKDTIKLGDTYETKIYYEVRDLAKIFTIKLDNGVFIKDTIYREIATKKGLNIRKGELYLLNNRKRLLLPFEFSFYVE